MPGAAERQPGLFDRRVERERLAEAEQHAQAIEDANGAATRPANPPPF